MTVRILHVVTSMDMGGLENFIMNIYRNIDRSKVQFDFLKHRENESYFDKEISSLGGRIYSVPRINPFKHKQYIKALDDFFENHTEYNIVHSHNNAYSMYVLRSAKKADIPVRLAHSHVASQSNKIYKLPFLKYAKSKIKDYSTHNFACGIDAGKWLYGEDNLKKSNFKVVKNGIDTTKFVFNPEKRELVRQHYNIEDKFVIGHIGRFSDQKNHDFIIDIFKEIYDRSIDSVLILVGDGNLKEKIYSKVKMLGLENQVIFTGVKSNTNELLQAMDVYLMPSKYEGLPVTMIEAQASGIQSVISDTIDQDVKITDLVDFLSLDKSPSYWAEWILKYNYNYKRSCTLQEVKNAGYDAKESAKWLEQFYIKNSNR